MMMISRSHYKKRSYSAVYKIYRRLRFIRYKKRATRWQKIETDRKEIQERRETRQKLIEFRNSEKELHRLKQKADQEEKKRLKKELREEFRQRDLLFRQEWQKLTKEDQEKARQARLLEKRERKKQLRHNLKSSLENFIGSFRSINIRSLKSRIKDFRENAPQRRLLGLISFNSTVLFVLAYLVLYLIYQGITVIAASFFSYPTIVYYYDIYFNISQEAWYHDSVKTIFSSGPVVNFVIGITFLIIYSNIREAAGPFKLFFLWGFLHSVNMLFGALLIGTLFETGVGHVISWMYIMDTGKVLYSIISIFILVIAGIISARHFLISGNTYYNEINNENRTSFILAQVLVPYLAGNLFLVLLRQPHFVFYDTFIVLALIISLLPVLVIFRSYNELYFEEEEKKPHMTWVGLVILAAVILFFRGVLAIGLRFG